MSVRRLRGGEWLALAAGVALLVLLFLPWFHLNMAVAGQPHRSGWGGLGWATDVVLVLAIGGAVALAALTADRTGPALAVSASAATVAFGAIVFVVLLVRLTLGQPALGVGAPNHAVDLRWPAYAGLLGAALIPVGALLSLRDERTDAPESAYTPPPARPAPGT